MTVEATFYTLKHPIPEALLSSMRKAPGVESLEKIEQTDLHEHLVGFVGYASAVTEGADDERMVNLVRFILSVGDAIDFRFEANPAGDLTQLRIREQLAPFGGIWLTAAGVFDVDGKLILSNEGEREDSSLIPEVLEPRRTNAEFLYGALERERELEDAGEELGATRLTEHPLEECYRMIEFGRRKAHGYGFTDVEDQLSFVSVMLEIGPNFDEHPEIKKILSNPQIPASEKMDACFDHEDAEQIWNEVAEMIDPSRWSEATAH